MTLDQRDVLKQLTPEETDNINQKIIESSKESNPKSPQWKLLNGFAYFGSRIYVPKAARDQILHLVHDVETIHAGQKQTIDKLAMDFYWPTMGKDTRQWIKCCDNCQRKHKVNKTGLLRSLAIAKTRFTDMALGWFSPPSTENDYGNILLAIDRHRKYLFLIPCKTTDLAKDTAKQYVQHVYQHAGLPNSMTVDRDSKWCSEFWTSFSNTLDVKMNIATSRHQNTNGLAEQAVKTTKRTLTTILNSSHIDNWLDALPLVTFAYNSTPHTSTGFTPFELTYGSNPKSISTTIATANYPSKPEIVATIER